MTDTSFVCVSCGGSVQFIPFGEQVLAVTITTTVSDTAIVFPKQAAKAYEKARTLDRPEAPKHIDSKE